MLRNNHYFLFLRQLWDKVKSSRRDNFFIEFNIVDHCNNSCRYCSHFSPIASKREISLESFEHDLKLLAPIVSGHVSSMHLMGGEPLLHPQIEDLLVLSRHYLKQDEIAIVTNGILLKKMPESFYRTVRENNIYIRISTYPIGIDYNEIMEYVRGKGCLCECYHIADEMSYRPMDEHGRGNILYNYVKCKMGGLCLQVKDGKLFYCAYSAYQQILNDKFHTSFNHAEHAFLELEKIKSLKDIYKFRLKPNGDCRYCLVKEWKSNPWMKSTKLKEEWIKPTL